MTLRTKRALQIGLPIMAGAIFLFFYLRKSAKKAPYEPEDNPGKAKKTPEKEPTPAVISQSNAYPLKNGVYNSALVSQLQKILNSKGASLTVDGDFGPKTEAALLKYYGKKQIDDVADFNKFKIQVPGAQLINTKTAKAQLIVSNYKKSSFSEIFCTMDTQVTVVEQSGSGYVLTRNNISFNKLQAFNHDRFVPLGVSATGDLVAKYISSWIGVQTYIVYADPEALSVK